MEIVKSTLLTLLALVFLVACKQTPQQTEEATNLAEPKPLAYAETSDAEISNNEDQTQEPELDPSKISYENFAGFFYRFGFGGTQSSKVRYPMQVRSDIIMTHEGWNTLEFPRTWEAIPLIYQDTLDMFKHKLQGDVSLTIFNYFEKSGLELLFQVIDNEWMLTEIKQANADILDQDDFISFFASFALDTLFQMTHIQFPLEYRHIDYTDFERITTNKHVSDWQHLAFSEDLGGLYIVNQKENKSLVRYLHYPGIESGVNVLFTFLKLNGVWKLSKWEDYSF